MFLLSVNRNLKIYTYIVVVVVVVVYGSWEYYNRVYCLHNAADTSEYIAGSAVYLLSLPVHVDSNSNGFPSCFIYCFVSSAE